MDLEDKIRKAVLDALTNMPELKNMIPADGEPITTVIITTPSPFGYHVEFDITNPDIIFSGA